VEREIVDDILYNTDAQSNSITNPNEVLDAAEERSVAAEQDSSSNQCSPIAPASEPKDDTSGLLSPFRSLAQALQQLVFAPQATAVSPEHAASPGSEKTEVSGGLISAFSQLFVQFQRSVPQVEASKQEASTALNSEAPVEDVVAVRNKYTISKYQEALTIAEGKVWKELARADNEDTAYGDLLTQVTSLLDQSLAMTESYDRRANPPTFKTYEESREILDALGVQCITTAGAYEAEALASSLVVNGYADYVVSEDTVCQLPSH
jgi:flap endonuclease-1